MEAKSLQMEAREEAVAPNCLDSSVQTGMDRLGQGI
jgi:hypothetical protein